MVASNTKDCFRYCIGKQVTGVLFDALPLGRCDLSSGTKTMIFEDGTGLTIANNGSFWIESADEIQRAVRSRKEELETTQRELADVLAVAGQ